MDSNGNVLFELNSEQEMDMASITKVMTAIVALDSGIELDRTFPFVNQEYVEDAQLTEYKDGDMPSLRELLMVSLVYSGNDAAYNIAIAVSGSVEAFVELMNNKAVELGLTHTHFANPHGLNEPGHYSCALDMCKMGRYAMENYPFIRDAVRTRTLSISPGGHPVTLESTDQLMDYYDGLLGIKTGWLGSGASFLGCARRGYVTLYSCVLCCDTYDGRWNDTASMLDWGFDLYDPHVLARSNSVLRNAPWRDGFWLSCPVSATLDINGSVYCDGGAVTPSLAMRTANTLTAPNATYGTSVWRQDGRHLGSVEYRSASTPKQVSAWNPFVLPLFEDVGGVLA